MSTPTTPSPPSPSISSQSVELEMAGITLLPGDAIGPYRYLEPVGKGGMAHVLLAQDPGGRKVALKVLKASRFRTGLSRFRREFRALARLNHKNVIRVDAYGDIHGHPYIAMEFVEGTDLHRAMRTIRRLPHTERWAETEKVLVDMCQALAYIHKRGLIHRDIKPSNILIDQAGCCKLTDFGIVKHLDPSTDPFVSQTLVGTWAYASPEQISGRALDQRSDLYSLGIILYAMLAGRRPFVASDMAGYLELHRTSDPTPPSVYEPDVPAELEEICLKLLRKEPRDRFQSAQEILYNLEQFGTEEQEANTLDPGEWQPPLAGRRPEVDRLKDVVGALSRGEGGAVVISGEEGAGKSRLLELALNQARLSGFPVHMARVAPAQGSFEALLEIAREIGGELGDQVPLELDAAVSAFARGRGQLPGDARYQLFDGIRDALTRLLENGPRVLAIDDLHHAPPALLELIGYIVRSLLVRDGMPLLIVTTVREAPSPKVAAFITAESLGLEPLRLTVGGLTPAEVVDYVERALGSSSDARRLGRQLHTVTAGNPFLVAEFIRSMVQRGLLRVDPGGSLVPTVDGKRLVGALGEVPPSVRKLVEGRLAPLAPGARRVADAIAVSGREVELETLLDVLDDDEEAVLDRLEELVDTGLLIERRAGAEVFYDYRHRIVGGVGYQTLTDDAREGLHRRFGAALELRHASSPAVAEAIGEHYRRARDDARAYRYLVLAALRLSERSLLGEAWQLSERAAALESSAEAMTPAPDFLRSRRQLLQVRAESWYNRGLWREAFEALTALVDAAALAGDGTQWARASLQLGVVERRLGLEAEGTSRVESVLIRARERHDRDSAILALRHLAAIAWELGDFDACEAFASQGLIAATGPELAPRRAEILTSLTAVQATRGQLAVATGGLEEADDILRGLRTKRPRVLVLCNLAELLSWQGEMAKSIRRSTEALALADDVVYQEGIETALRVRAMALLDAGALESAAADLERSLAVATSLGLAEDIVATRFLCGRLAFHQGDLPGAREHLEAGLVTAVRRDPESYAPALKAMLARVLALSGQRSAARRLLAEVDAAAPALLLPRRTQVLALLAVGHLTVGECSEALEVARQAARLAENRGFRMWAMRAQRVVAETAQPNEAALARSAAKQLAEELHAGLPDALAPGFRARPGMRALLEPT